MIKIHLKYLRQESSSTSPFHPLMIIRPQAGLFRVVVTKLSTNKQYLSRQESSSTTPFPSNLSTGRPLSTSSIIINSRQEFSSTSPFPSNWCTGWPIPTSSAGGAEWNLGFPRFSWVTLRLSAAAAAIARFCVCACVLCLCAYVCIYTYMHIHTHTHTTREKARARERERGA